jgi:hypothetical protein
MTNFGFVINHTTCVGCPACTFASKAENDVPLGAFRTGDRGHSPWCDGRKQGCTKTSRFLCTPISGQYGWPQEDDRYGDIFVDTAKAFYVYQEWIEKTRPALEAYRVSL